FHVIGEIFDRVYTEAGTGNVNTNVQTTLIPAGGAAVVEFKVETTGSYILVDHSIFRAFNKGAMGTLVVDGTPDSGVFSGRQYEGIYQPEGGAMQRMPTAAAPAVPAAKNREEQIAMGERVYTQNC